MRKRTVPKLARITGKQSAKDMTEVERRKVLRLRREALLGVDIVDMRKLREAMPPRRREWRMWFDVSVRCSDRFRSGVRSRVCADPRRRKSGRCGS